MVNRVVSLLASGTEILYGLGLGECVVGVSHECDFPEGISDKPRLTRARIDDSAPSGDIDEQVKGSLTAGEPLYEINVDLLGLLRPDVIVTQSHCDVCAVSLDDLQRAIRESAALSETRVVALNPMTLDGILNDILAVGSACGVPDRATQYVSELRARIADVRERTNLVSASDRPRTACIEWIEPVMLGGNWMPELIEIAGGRCPLATSGVRSTYSRWDDLRNFDPQVIVVMPCGFDIERTKNEAPALRRNAGWDELCAVCDNRVYAVDGNAYFNRSGPRIVDSLELLGHILHPNHIPANSAPIESIG